MLSSYELLSIPKVKRLFYFRAIGNNYSRIILKEKEHTYSWSDGVLFSFVLISSSNPLRLIRNFIWLKNTPCSKERLISIIIMAPITDIISIDIPIPPPLRDDE